MKKYLAGNIQQLIRKNWKKYVQFAIAFVFILFAIHFFGSQGNEMTKIQIQLVISKKTWIFTGIGITILYVVLQGYMYQYSFKSIGKKASLYICTILFLKRNFISVFLPAGGITSLAFFNNDLIRKKIQKKDIHIASSIYAFIGIFSVVITSIPILIYALFQQISLQNALVPFSLLLVLMVAFIYFIWNIKQKKKVYTLLQKRIPSIDKYIDGISNNQLNKKAIIVTILLSIVIDIIGIYQLYFAMFALHLQADFYIAALAYTVAVILLIVSPFLRGAGAIEVSIVYILGKFGYSTEAAIGTALLFRFFEFWLPLIFGAIAFLSKINRLIVRIIPSCFVFLLGIVNIHSVLTPPIYERFQLEKSILSLKTIHTSNYFVLMAGLFLLMNAFLLLKGVRTAYITAITLCCISILGNLLKSLDYEEAIIAIIVLLTLLVSAKEYKVRPKMGFSQKTGHIILLSCATILLYGYIGIYYFNYQYWHTHMAFVDVSKLLFRNLLMLKNPRIWMANHVTKYFFYSINIWSFSVICYLLVLLLRPKYLKQENVHPNDLSLAKEMLYRMKDSANDFFKIWEDKQIYFSISCDGFLSYKAYKNYVIVLENPVIADIAQLPNIILEFEFFCKQKNIRPFYYRTSQHFIDAITGMKKKKILIGQEAILDLNTFSLSGKSMKSVRNAINNAQRNKLTAYTHLPPIKDGLLQRLQQVSDLWLSENNRKEINFSQGIFEWDILKNQTIMTVENEEGMVVAFLNILPTFERKEATYDLIRYIPDAPNGTIDYLLVEAFEYLKKREIEKVDIGFAPFSGLNEMDVKNFLERSIEFTHEKVKPIANYQQGLRKSKEKFAPSWENRFLVYNEDFDLVQFPIIFNKIIKV